MTKKNDYRNLLMQYFCIGANKTVGFDRVFKKEFQSKVEEEYAKDSSRFLELMDYLLEDLRYYMTDKTKEESYRNFIKQLVDSHFANENTKTKRYLVNNAHVDISQQKYTEFLSNVLQQKIENLYSKMNQKQKKQYYRAV